MFFVCGSGGGRGAFGIGGYSFVCGRVAFGGEYGVFGACDSACVRGCIDSAFGIWADACAGDGGIEANKACADNGNRQYGGMSGSWRVRCDGLGRYNVGISDGR